MAETGSTDGRVDLDPEGHARRLQERLHAPERLAAVEASGIDDPRPDESIDRIARLGSQLLGVPVVLVSVVGADRQLFKSAVGVEEPWVSGRSTPLSHSFCQHVVADGSAFVVEDARRHPLVAGNLAVAELAVMAYLGVPLRDVAGQVLGAFCAIDHNPRRWTPRDQEVLDDLSAALTTELRLRHLAEELAGAVAAERTARQHLEATSGSRFRQLADGAADVIYEFQVVPELQMVYINPAIEQLTGYPPTAFYDDPGLLATCVHPDDIETVRTAQLAAAPEVVEFRVRHRDGSRLWAAMRTTLVTDVHGGVVAVQGIIRDIDRQKQQEAALLDALEQQRLTAAELHRVMTMRSSFLTAISHEMRTPLTAVIGLAELLHHHDDRLSDDRRSELVGRLRASAQRLDGLLADILDVRHLEAVRAAASTRLDVLVTAVVEQLDVGTGRLELELEPTDVRIDRPPLERVIRHLVNNAVVHTPPTTPIRIVARSVSPTTTELIVQDRGPGIPDQLKRDVFEPFVQGPERADAASPGTGIGLSLVRELVRAYGGAIHVEDTPGGGATLRVSLPREGT